MERMTENKIVLVVRKTRLDDLVARFNTIAQAQFYVEHLGADFSDYLNEHDNYKKSVIQAREILEKLGRVQIVDRTLVPNFIFGVDDVIIALGQDGLVVNTLKYLSAQPIIGVNPDPKRWDGILLPFEVSDLAKIVPDVFCKNRPVKEITMAKASLNDGQCIYGVNDLFIGQKTHVSARYQIKHGEVCENHSSSGIIVSTGLGSTGWLTSIVAGAIGVVSGAAGKNMQIKSSVRFAWDTEQLYFSVREPFPSKISTTSLVFGKIRRDAPLKIISQMAEGGVIFSDGIESDYVSFNSGVEAIINLAEKRGKIVV